MQNERQRILELVEKRYDFGTRGDYIIRGIRAIWQIYSKCYG
ncbi:hypothetical protein OL548_09905 [Lysinibacillus sp. MHQ-1]|nr:hypothetical protein OL548_09905 [Lysinibacillus sp. MHQ-1]